MGEYRQSRHAPGHLLIPGAIYMVTAGTYQRIQLFNSSRRMEALQDIIQERCRLSGWDLRAWVVLQNHYHFIAQSPMNEANLPGLIRSIHSKSAIMVNRADGVLGRRVWYNYWDTCIRSESAYQAGLRYILQNPKWHGIVTDFTKYKYSNYRMLTKEDDAAFREILPVSGLEDLELIDDY